jgi:hypothetical protein
MELHAAMLLEPSLYQIIIEESAPWALLHPFIEYSVVLSDCRGDIKMNQFMPWGNGYGSFTMEPRLTLRKPKGVRGANMILTKIVKMWKK